MKVKIIEDNIGKVRKNMKLYKFRSLGQNDTDYKRIIDIIENGFYCNDFLGFNDMNEGIYNKNNLTEGVTLEGKMDYKICSFSGERALDSELMWGHYANAGKGIVIEVTLNEKCLDSIKNVKYDSTSDLKNYEEILTNKSPVWSYEDEYRYLSEEELTDNKVKIGNITKIYFGRPYEHLENYEAIKENSISLQKYLELKEKLKNDCKSKDVECEDFDFKSLNRHRRCDEILKRRGSVNGISIQDRKFWAIK